MFDKITGTEPRIVQTPGALLAVRGTQYNVEVDAAGKTIVDVFEGTVEIRSPLRPEPFLVHAGETSIFSRRDPPPDHPMKTPDDRRQDAPGRRDGAPPDPHGGHDAPGATSRRSRHPRRAAASPASASAASGSNHAERPPRRTDAMSTFSRRRVSGAKAAGGGPDGSRWSERSERPPDH